MPAGHEDRARERIDAMLEAAGWRVQGTDQLDLHTERGVAVREFQLPSTGAADYLLFADREAAGIVEAKAEGTTLGGVAEQSGQYLIGLPKEIPHVDLPLFITYETTRMETYFRDLRDPEPRSRLVFSFCRPETLAERLCQADTLRARLACVTCATAAPLRGCRKAKCIPFLVDHTSLGRHCKTFLLEPPYSGSSPESSGFRLTSPPNPCFFVGHMASPPPSFFFPHIARPSRTDRNSKEISPLEKPASSPAIIRTRMRRRSIAFPITSLQRALISGDSARFCC